MKRLARFALLLVLLGCRPAAPAGGRVLIVTPQHGSRIERYAAHELRRYIYLRTGAVAALAQERDIASAKEWLIIAAGRESLGKLDLGLGDDVQRAAAGLSPQSYLLKTVERGPGRRPVLIITGGDDAGLLYGVYGFLERLGVRFALHGDTIPDERLPLTLPVLDEARSPLFKLRGMLPFHDFPEGPDWWTRADYLAILAQAAKLKMNFIGLHNYTYPNYAPRAEPTVWIGTPGDFSEDGQVAFSYPTSYQNNLLDSWGYKPVPAGRFHFGTADLFEYDDSYGDVMHGLCPEPQTPRGSNELFDRAGELLRDAFGYAHLLGIKTCVGTEAPLVVPPLVRDRLAGRGVRLDKPAYRRLYAGIFGRIAKAYPIDYYWLWTPESWTWQGVADSTVKQTIDDILMAHDALKQSGAGFELATCGWVLGPPKDRSLFDKYLPRDMAISCINREVGWLPVDKGFAGIDGRPKWAIPWLEDDGALTIPQLWVGRMRRDAVDARTFGCDGLLGIHWRTKVIDPNVSALAAAAWQQADWPLRETAAAEPARESGPIDGKIAAFDANPIVGAADAPLYRTVRYDVSGYRFEAPNGRYTVILRFCEPQFHEKGKRVFGVKIQGRSSVEHLDIFARAGFSRPLDLTFSNVRVEDGRLAIDFVYELGQPCIAAIEFGGPGFSRKVNCGGPAYKDYLADLTVKTPDYRHLVSWISMKAGAPPSSAGRRAGRRPRSSRRSTANCPGRRSGPTARAASCPTRRRGTRPRSSTPLSTNSKP